MSGLKSIPITLTFLQIYFSGVREKDSGMIARTHTCVCACLNYTVCAEHLCRRETFSDMQVAVVAITIY